MNIADIISKSAVLDNVQAASKRELVQSLSERIAALSGLDERAVFDVVWERENLGSTGYGEGVAFPHARIEGLEKVCGMFARLEEPVDFDSLDGEPVTLLFLIAAPNTEDNVHLDVLSKLSVLMMDEDFSESLRNAKTVDEFLNIIDKADDEKPDIDERLETVQAAKVLAVTSCPTGIAHTYMAAEGLEKAAKAAGIAIKIETRGSGGAKNVLTQQEIDDADCIIVAADAQVPMERFDGKRVIECQVSDGINKADELIRKALAGDAPVYKAGTSEKKESTSAKKGGGIGHKIYTQLMNGVSHMLPFVVGGGILIAIAFLIDGLNVDMNALSEAERSNFGTITPVAAMFKTIGGAAFGFMLPVLAGYIAYSIADRPGLAVGFVGGYLAKVGNSFANITGDGAVSGVFLAALLAGFVAGYLVLLLQKIASKLPESMDGIKPVLIYPLFGVFFIGVFMYAVNPAMAAINTGIINLLNSMGGSSKILLGAIVAGMMSIDMGGPFNKAAYVFGTASIASGNYDVMAAVMIGGMIPPLAIALATTFFKKKFTADERKSGVVNYIMGLCFITEGAIPYAASDPLRVIPSCMVGSAVAGLVCALFGCACPAPHGGVFTFAVVDHPLGYIVALVAGSVVGALMLALLKKNKTEKERA